MFLKQTTFGFPEASVNLFSPYSNFDLVANAFYKCRCFPEALSFYCKFKTLNISVLLHMLSFDHKFSWNAKCKRFRIFTFKMLRIWNTRRSAIETMNFPAELCHIWSWYSEKYFICCWNNISFMPPFTDNCLLARAMNFNCNIIFLVIRQVQSQSLILNKVTYIKLTCQFHWLP